MTHTFNDSRWEQERKARMVRVSPEQPFTVKTDRKGRETLVLKEPLKIGESITITTTWRGK